MGNLRAIDTITRGEKKQHAVRVRKAVKAVKVVDTNADIDEEAFRGGPFHYAADGIEFVVVGRAMTWHTLRNVRWPVPITVRIPVRVPWGMKKPEIAHLVEVLIRLEVASARP